jgi:hypothetical protein
MDEQDYHKYAKYKSKYLNLKYIQHGGNDGNNALLAHYNRNPTPSPQYTVPPARPAPVRPAPVRPTPAPPVQTPAGAFVSLIRAQVPTNVTPQPASQSVSQPSSDVSSLLSAYSRPVPGQTVSQSTQPPSPQVIQRLRVSPQSPVQPPPQPTPSPQIRQRPRVSPQSPAQPPPQPSPQPSSNGSSLLQAYSRPSGNQPPQLPVPSQAQPPVPSQAQPPVPIAIGRRAAAQVAVSTTAPVQPPRGRVAASPVPPQAPTVRKPLDVNIRLNKGGLNQFGTNTAIVFGVNPPSMINDIGRLTNHIRNEIEDFAKKNNITIYDSSKDRSRFTENTRNWGSTLNNSANWISGTSNPEWKPHMTGFVSKSMRNQTIKTAVQNNLDNAVISITENNIKQYSLASGEYVVLLEIPLNPTVYRNSQLDVPLRTLHITLIWHDNQSVINQFETVAKNIIKDIIDNHNGSF